MGIVDLAKDFVEPCRQGDVIARGELYWSHDMVSVEATGESAVLRGKDAVSAKDCCWRDTHEIHAC